MKRFIVLAVAVVFMLVAGNAMALPFNERPLDELTEAKVNWAPGSEHSLQTILDNVTDGAVDAVLDQSSSAIWQPTDGDVDVYAVTMFTAASGTLGVYSYSTGQEVDLMSYGAALGGVGLTNPSDYKVDFSISTSGYLIADNGNGAGFGSFGFYWRVGNNTYYTEDDENDVGARALAYQLEDGVVYDVNAYGAMDAWFAANDPSMVGNPYSFGSTGDEWILAWEDGTDLDFNDAVFVIEDIEPVPEPGTLLLLGAGLLGLVGFRKRMK